MDWINLKRFFLAVIKPCCRCHNTIASQYIIIGQEIIHGKTLFMLRDSDRVVGVSAQDLYKDHVLLENISRKDLITIVSTAIQEQAIDDFAPAVMWQKIEPHLEVDLDYNPDDLD